MKRKELILIALCALLVGGCAGRTSGGKYVDMVIQKRNMAGIEIYDLRGNVDGHYFAREMFLPINGQATMATVLPSWPKRLNVRWKLEGIEGVREQEMDLPPYPLMPDGTLSIKPHLFLVFFEDRVLAFSDIRWLYGEIEKKAKIEYEAARAAGVPGARIVSPQEEEKKLALEERRPQPNVKTDVDNEKNLPPFPTCKDVDDCVRLAVLENSVFVEACGTVVPEIKKEMQNAFANWVVLKLPIPGLQQTLSPDNPDRASLLAHILPYLKEIPSHEMSIECGGRYAMMKNPEPTILSDAASLPKDVLKRYQR